MSLGIKIPRNALKSASKEYAKNPKGSGNVELERGTYVGCPISMRGVDTTNGPALVVNIKVGGDVDDSIKNGQTALWWNLSEERAVHMFRDLNKLGYDVDDLDEETLEEIAKDLEANNPVIKFKVNAKGFINLVGLVEDEDAESIGVEVEDKKEKKSKKKDKKPKDKKDKKKKKKNKSED